VGVKDMKVRLRRNGFDRWIVVHPEVDDAAWSGSRWVSIDKHGFPTYPTSRVLISTHPIVWVPEIHSCQVSNLSTEKEAAEYATQFDFQTAFEDEYEENGGVG
jgi:hypothetical protein